VESGGEFGLHGRPARVGTAIVARLRAADAPHADMSIATSRDAESPFFATIAAWTTPGVDDHPFSERPP